MDEKQFAIISKKLDTIILLLAAETLKDKNKKDSILLLKKLGFDNPTIASMVGSTPHSVAVANSVSRKTKASKPKDGKPDGNLESNLGGEAE